MLDFPGLADEPPADLQVHELQRPDARGDEERRLGELHRGYGDEQKQERLAFLGAGGGGFQEVKQ